MRTRAALRAAITLIPILAFLAGVFSAKHPFICEGAYVGSVLLAFYFADRCFRQGQKTPLDDYPECPHTIENGVICFDQYSTNQWFVRIRKILSTRIPHWNYSGCHACGLPWWVVKGHTIYLPEGNGVFAICESCWEDVPAAERVNHYLDVISSWGQAPTIEQIEAVEKAVCGDGPFHFELHPSSGKQAN